MAMNINSKHFDKVRIKSRRGSAKKEEAETRICEWAGCDRPATHRAPKRGSGAPQFHHFCLDHVRQYNQSFNFFADQKDADQLGDMLRRAAQTGERPTWSMGANSHGRGNPRPRQSAPRDFSGQRFSDPLNLFARLARNQGKTNPITDRERRISEQDRRAFETLGLEGYPKANDIKKAYKALVKMHHPDANGGDRGSEDRLRAIIAAYTHLKKKGMT